jgi:hypothetical protein
MWHHNPEDHGLTNENMIEDISRQIFQAFMMACSYLQLMFLFALKVEMSRFFKMSANKPLTVWCHHQSTETRIFRICTGRHFVLKWIDKLYNYNFIVLVRFTI